MDSHNLAVVFLPVLVRSADIRQDALICTMPRKVKVSAIDDNKQKHEGNGISKTSSLGMILKLCIDRFDEVFPASHLGTAQPPGTASMGMTPKSSRTRSGSSRSSTVCYELFNAVGIFWGADVCDTVYCRISLRKSSAQAVITALSDTLHQR